jgi:5-(carboxyamino)imidazole ribonucleotide synthase
MMALAAANLGLRTHIYSPDGFPDGTPGHSPAGQIAHHETIGAYEDLEAIARFGDTVDVATYEFENVPAETAAELAKHTRLAPGARALDVAQDRITEKDFLTAIGEKTAPYKSVDTLDDLKKAISKIGLPAVLKTRRFGYDGKGQVIIRSRDDVERAFAAMKGAPSILEGFIPFKCEISVIAARSQRGRTESWTPGENIHRDHILAVTIVPARVADETIRAARTAAENVLALLEYVGVIGVEFFVLEDGSILINEIAPRVHNSGHWTEAACVLSQFEQHIRAICGWPLVDPGRHSDAIMYNLIGDDVDKWEDIAGTKNMELTLYGKEHARPGRKMAHATRLYPKGTLASLKDLPLTL